MAKQLLGTVNEYGKEALEGCACSKVKYVFEPKDSIKVKAFGSGPVTWSEKVVTWTAWMVVPNEYEPKSQKDYDSLTGYAGD